MDRNILHATRTIPVPKGALDIPVDQVKLRLLRQRAVTVKSALENIRGRKLLTPEAQPRRL